jgi:uncharacterized protein YbgA (DUF1722 family)
MAVLLHRIGWSVQVPARRAAERDEEKIAGWREDTWPVIKARRRTWAPGSAGKTSTEDEGRLNDPGRREAFTERIFAAARLRALLSGPAQPRDLVAFHARHKLQLLAHDPARYRSAGRVVATAGQGHTAAAYRDLFLAAMAAPATRGRHANALQHAYSRIGRELDRPRRADLVARIEAYRRGQAPLSVPVALLAHYAGGGGFPWLAEQTYLQPFPAELGLRHGI